MINYSKKLSEIENFCQQNSSEPISLLLEELTIEEFMILILHLSSLTKKVTH